MEKSEWLLTNKCKLYPQGILSKTYKYREIMRINQVLIEKAQKEAAERAERAAKENLDREQSGTKTIKVNRARHHQY